MRLNIKGEAWMLNNESLPQDPYILLSTINMKLRNQFKDIYKLCQYYNIDINDLNKKLGEIGYTYDIITNQFK